jgi:capsule synthesis protein PGA_cap
LFSHSSHLAGHAAAAVLVTLSWVGDITPGSRYGTPPGAGDAQFAHVRKFLEAPDFALGNLEGTLSRGGRSKCRVEGGDCFSFQASGGHAGSLRRAGFDLLNVANNHAFDFGPFGQRQTLTALTRKNLAYSGRPGQITILRKDRLRVAVVGFAPYHWAASLNDIPAARRLIHKAKRMADIVVVMIHAGAEGTAAAHVPFGHEHAFGEDRGNTRAFAHSAIDAGAAIVLGSGPHVLRGIERYRRRLIAYSLGNFAGWHNFGMGGALSLSAILSVQLDGEGTLVAAHLLPMRLSGPGIPSFDSSRASLTFVNRLGRADFGKRAAQFRRDGSLRPTQAQPSS